MGSSDLDQEEGLFARFKAWLIGMVLYDVMQKGQLLCQPDEWVQEVHRAAETQIKKVLDRTIDGLYNNFISSI